VQDHLSRHRKREHTVEVTAESLYEAVARGSAAFGGADWVSPIGHGQTTISVLVKQPEVEYTVRMRDFEARLGAPSGGCPRTRLK
jgi:hypothetical protein